MYVSIFTLEVLFQATDSVNYQTLSTKVRSNMMKALLRQDLRFFDRPENTVGATAARLDSIPQAILELMGINISFSIISIISVIACCILSLIVAWKVAVVGIFVGLPPLLLSGWLRIKLESRLNTITNQSFSRSASLASETVLAIRTVSSLAIEEDVLQRYTKELDVAIRKCTPKLFHVMIWFSFTQAVEQFVLALGFWYVFPYPPTFARTSADFEQVGIEAGHQWRD